MTEKESIDPGIYERGFTPEQIAKIQEKIDSGKSREAVIMGYQFTGDLERFNFSQFNFVMTAFQLYNQNGTLPFPGSLSEQPAQIMDIMTVLEQIKFEVEAKQRRKMEREQKAMRNKNRG